MRNLIKTVIFLGVFVSAASIPTDSYCYDCTAQYRACVSDCSGISNVGRYEACMRGCFSKYSHCLN